MKNNADKTEIKNPEDGPFGIKRYGRNLIDRFRNLKGDPTYVAKGVAIGVFIGVTPTIPFHTVLAVALAVLFRASKPAAIVGVWFGNPLTIPFFYYGSYKIGALLFHLDISLNFKEIPMAEILKMGVEATAAIQVGGVILGLPFGIASYFITRPACRAWQKRRKAKQDISDRQSNESQDGIA